MNQKKMNVKAWMFLGFLLFFAVVFHANAVEGKNPAPSITVSTSEKNPNILSLETNWKFQIDPEDTGLTKKWNEVKFDDSKWKNIPVPSYWENAGITTENPNWTKDDLHKPYSGYAWYRIKIQIPSTWTNDTVFLVMGKIDDWDWTYLNGELVGHTGEETSNPDKELRIYAVPCSKLKPGKENLLAIRVCDIRGEGGIYSGPVSLNYKEKPIIKSNKGTQGDVVSIGGNNIEIKEEEIVNGDVVAIGRNISVKGKVSGDVVSIGGTISLASTAEVSGDVVTVGGKMDRAPGSQVRGEVVVTDPGISKYIEQYKNRFGGESYKGKSPSRHKGGAGFGLFLFIGLLFSFFFIVMGMLVAAFIPENLQRVANTIEFSPGKSFAIGLASLILTIPFLLLLLITCIGIPLIPLAIVLLLLAWIIGYAAMGLLVATKLCKYFKWNIQSIIGLTVLGIVILSIIKLVPCLGFIVVLLLAITGFGAVIYSKSGTIPRTPNYPPSTPVVQSWPGVPPVPPVPSVPPTPPPSNPSGTNNPPSV